MRTKYNSKKVVLDDIVFDSKEECLYYQHLLALKSAGFVESIELQPKYELIPKYSYFGKKCKAITYTPDFKINWCGGEVQLVDVKGYDSQQGVLRRKLFEHKYPDLLLTWVARNIKHGDEYGWIEYDQLKKIRANAKKLKKKDEDNNNADE